MQGVQNKGFTIVELLIVVVVIAIIATIGIMAYQGTQRRGASALVSTTAKDATKQLENYYLDRAKYPSNLADTDFTAPQSVAMSLYTNAPQTPVYENLNDDQNAQLFLNACNGFMPIVNGSTTYNTSCVYSGRNGHIKGQTSSNVVIKGPSIEQADFVLICGSLCTSTQQDIIATFLAQGGRFPVIVPKAGAALPAPTMQTSGEASDYCVEARSGYFDDVVFHATAESGRVVAGHCPDNPELHYP